MVSSIDRQFKEKIISGIKNGLNNTQSMYYGQSKRICNAKHLVKMDEIANSIIDSIERFGGEEDFHILTLPRGAYDVLLVYCVNTGILLSFMSKNRFKTLIHRKDHSKVHYLDALVAFNDKHNFDRQQLVIDESFICQDLDVINNIKENVKSQLGELDPSYYLTIVMDMNYFRLSSVEAVLTSQYLEVIEREDWSDLIQIDYDDINHDELELNVDEDDLNISIKQNGDDITEDDITPKVSRKEGTQK